MEQTPKYFTIWMNEGWIMETDALDLQDMNIHAQKNIIEYNK